MTTKGNLITKVAGDLSRSDLTSAISEAIDKAIAFIQDERLISNVTRSSTFPTVATRYIYTDTDLVGPPALSQFYEFDAVWVEDSDGQRYPLTQTDYFEIEYVTDNAQSSGRPYSFARYKNDLWLYPVPDTVYTIRIAGHYELPGPADDSEVGNRWMVDPLMFEYLRYAAQEDIYANRIKDMDKALKATTLKDKWLQKLRARTSRKQGQNRISSSEGPC